MEIRKILQDKSVEFGDKLAIIFKEQQITFQELNNNVLKLANALRDKGVEKGVKIAVYLPNCVEYVYSYLACFCIGAVVVPLDYMLKTDELTSCLDHSEAKILIARPKPVVDLDQLKKDLPSLENIISCCEELAGSEQISDLIANASSELEEVIISDDDPCLIMYTSGTTGKPKGILLNYKHLEGSPAAMDHFVDLSENDIKLAAIPLSHIGGFIYVQNCIIFAITVILMDRFNPFEFLGLIDRYKVTCFHIVPPMYNAILTLKEIERFDLSSLRWVVVFGAPSSPEIMERFHKYCPNAKLLNGWGMTETCPPNTVTPMDSDNIASIGKPAPHCTIRIMDDEGNDVPIGEVGELVISGWVIMKEYYKDPELTKSVLGPEGLHTGDLGKFDENGYLYIVGRKKEMIKVGGQIVFAPEVESALYKNEEVAEVAVIGMSDAMKGEVIKAFVVLRKNSLLKAEDIRYFAREHLANFKVPHIIELRKELPKNRAGKIDKESLRNG